MARRTANPTGAEPSRLIRKSNELVEARYRYDIWQMRVFAKVLNLISPGDSDFQDYRIYFADFIKEFGLSKGGNIYQLIKSGAEGLLHKKVVVDELLDGRATELQTWLLSSVQTFKSEDDADYLQVTIHPKLKPYLLELRQKYLVYDIRNVLKLTSVYSIRIYELLKQYEKLGKRTFDVENLKLILGILPGEYKLYGHFKSKVILKAQADLLAETDISFDFKEKKEGKRVIAVTFFIHPNGEARAAKPEPAAAQRARAMKEKAADLQSPAFGAILAQAAGWGVAELKVRELFVEFGEARLTEAVSYTREQSEKGKIKDNVAGFFVKAVESGWKSSAAEVKKQATAAQKKRADANLAQNTDELKKWESALGSLLESRQAEAREIIRELAQSEPELAENAVERILTDSTGLRFLEKSIGRTGLDELPFDSWRTEKPLREAVMRQIERMRPEPFMEVQKMYDEPIKRARRAIEALREEERKLAK